MDLGKTLRISAAGMQAQGTRLKIIAQNLANVDSTGETPGALPYRRQVVTFDNVLDKAQGVERVVVSEVRPDTSEFKRKFDPGHPSADGDGYVLLPNVEPMIEMMDMREAQRSYEANLGVIEMTRAMLSKTIDLLRG